MVIPFVRRKGMHVDARKPGRTRADLDLAREDGGSGLTEAEAGERLRVRLDGTVHRIDTFWLSIARSRKTGGPA